MPVKVADSRALSERAWALGQRLFEVRDPSREFAVGTGARRPGKRLLAVGADCSSGKMYTTLALEKEMRRRGMKADFRATGQTGIFTAGDGLPSDPVVPHLR